MSRFLTEHVAFVLLLVACPTRSRVAFLQCVLCSSSEGDLCMLVHVAPVPGLFALSIVVFCSRATVSYVCVALIVLSAAKNSLQHEALQQDVLSCLDRRWPNNVQQPTRARAGSYWPSSHRQLPGEVCSGGPACCSNRNCHVTCPKAKASKTRGQPRPLPSEVPVTRPPTSVSKVSRIPCIQFTLHWYH